jgi:hypothetical protein
LLEEAADLCDWIDAGVLTVTAAYERLQQRRQDAAQRERDLERIAKELTHN